MGIIESDHDSLNSVSIISDYSSTTGDSFTTNTSEDATLLNRFNKVVLENATNKERIVEILSALPDLVIPETYTEVDTLEYYFNIPSGIGINEVIITVDTNDSSFSLGSAMEISHGGATGTAYLSPGDNENYAFDNFATILGTPFNGTVNMQASISLGVITISIMINPSDSGVFPSTEDWTLSIEGFDSHTIETGISAKDILGIPVCLPITEVYTEVDTLEHDFSIPSGTGIHEVIITVDTNDSTWTLADLSNLDYYLTHTGDSIVDPLQRGINNPANYSMDLSETTGDDDGVNILITATAGNPVIILTLTSNPSDGPFLGMFDGNNNYSSTEDWTFSIEGFDSHTINTSISATDTSGDPVALT